MNPFQLLLKSRKFWLMVLDTVIALVVFIVGKYAAFAIEDVGIIIGILQPVFVTLILAIAVEDAAAKRAGIHPAQG